jgi:hypothetical protein
MTSSTTLERPGTSDPYKRGQLFQQSILAFVLVLSIFLWESHIGFNIWDEGFLWYGVQRVMLGEIPIRDFMAYDPARYYWSAAFMSLWSDNGIVALRASVAIFQAFALVIGLQLVTNNTQGRNYAFWIASAFILLLWMFPSHKLFDVSISILLVGALTFLIRRPIPSRFFITGVSIGLIAIFGRNHGVYGAISCFTTILYLGLRRQQGPSLINSIAIWILGIIVGYLPVLLLALLDPGFAQAFYESIRFLFEIQATNLGLPIPWPWKVDFGAQPLFDAIRATIVGILFIALPTWGIIGVAWAIKRQFKGRPPLPAPLVAATFTTLPYAFLAYSRADFAHLAHGIFPFLIGMLILVGRLPQLSRWLLTTLMVFVSIVAIMPMRPAWHNQTNPNWQEMTVGHDTLRINPNTAHILSMFHRLADDFAPGERPFLTTPFWPGAYAALFRKAPMWEIFAFFPRDAHFQQTEITRIKAANPGFVVVFDYALDGQDALRFRNTHPLILDYIIEHYDPQLGYTDNPAYQIFTQKAK